jgi:hypothetical protein
MLPPCNTNSIAKKERLGEGEREGGRDGKEAEALLQNSRALI